MRVLVRRRQPIGRGDVARDDRLVERDRALAAADRASGGADVFVGKSRRRLERPAIGRRVATPEGVGVSLERPLGELEHAWQQGVEIERREETSGGLDEQAEARNLLLLLAQEIVERRPH